jgi:hypothetical protein
LTLKEFAILRDVDRMCDYFPQMINLNSHDYIVRANYFGPFKHNERVANFPAEVGAIKYILIQFWNLNPIYNCVIHCIDTITTSFNTRKLHFDRFVCFASK